MLSKEEIKRYSRQLLLPSIGPKGQRKILDARVLVVGCGGLGSPLLLYLAAAGTGTLGVVDYDELESSNLQRQIAHAEQNVGLAKTSSAKLQIQQLNSNIVVKEFNLLLDSTNAIEIIEKFDVVCDCSDNVATRYLLNDACVLLNKPLVSGGALRMDGQLTVYHYKDGPCYRCLFPSPPSPSSVTNCNEGGVLGAITGIIGSIQALEVLKIIVGLEPAYGKAMLLLDGLEGTFRTIKIRKRNPNCAACGLNPTIQSLIDYVLFCGSKADDKVQNLKILDDDHRISVQEYNYMTKTDHILLDVRPDNEYEICNLKPNVHIPLKQLKDHIDEIQSWKVPIYVVCKHGNDSQLAVQELEQFGIESKDIRGGLDEWAVLIDSAFPRY
jgi:adenylyltransferase and sulfurtransferase